MERTYVIPLRKEWQNVPNYKRARRSIVAIKKFLARHMKIRDKEPDRIKLDIYLNNEVWFRGGKNPPIKIKVKAFMDGENVRAELADVPDAVKFAKAKHEKRHKKAEKKAEKQKTEEKKGEKTEEQKKEEAEKEKSSAIAKEQIAEQQAKAQKHTSIKKEPRIKRMALKK